MDERKVICWFSGGVTSAVACKLAIDHYGPDKCRCIFMDTKNEDDDTYRFMGNCEKWYGVPIETITRTDYNSIQEVWRKFNSLNVAHGAICSSELKRDLRKEWEKSNKYIYQVFGFDIDEPKRAKSMTLNYPNAKPIYPLLLHGYSKKHCIEILIDADIEIPVTYKYGFHNNNCFKTGCVQGGIGYWQKMQREFPDKFNAMADMEHELTEAKGVPVTMLKDQSKAGGKVFLRHHPKYPYMKDISMMKGREPKPLTDCNGFCSINDLERNPTELELNFENY